MKKILLSLSLFIVLFSGCKKDDDITPKQMLINGRVAVDLGLPSGLKWATCNIGAANPTDEGNYYCWGKIKDKRYGYDEYNYSGDVPLNDISGNPDYDVATHKWGASWRIPTADEMTELLENCEWIETKMDKVAGYKVVGPNGNFIFLPLTGYYKGDEKQEEGTTLCYTTSIATGYYNYIYVLYDGYGGIEVAQYQNYYGRSVRAVTR